MNKKLFEKIVQNIENEPNSWDLSFTGWSINKGNTTIFIGDDWFDILTNGSTLNPIISFTFAQKIELIPIIRKHRKSFKNQYQNKDVKILNEQWIDQE
jgi:hypothetical protein